MKLNMEEFLFGNVVDAIVSQVMIILKEKNLQLVHEIPDEIKTLNLFGDQVRLQLVLSDFLLNIAQYAPTPNGWVEIKVSHGFKLIQNGNELVRLQFRYSCYKYFQFLKKEFIPLEIHFKLKISYFVQLISL